MFRNIFKPEMTKNSELKIKEIVNKMQMNQCPSRGEIDFIIQNKRISCRLLCEIIEEVDKWKEVPDGISDVYMHSIFLLGALESEKGIDIVSRILIKDKDFVDKFFGDITNECLSWALTRMAKNIPKKLYWAAKTDTADTWERLACVRSLTEQHILYPQNKRKIIEYLRKLLQKAGKSSDPDWPIFLVEEIGNIAPVELRMEITDLYKQGLIDEDIVNIDSTGMAWQEPTMDFCMLEDDIHAVYENYGWMIAWNDPVIGGRKKNRRNNPSKIEQLKAQPKIGRNESCPCGSGKKYKKCCMGKTQRSNSQGVKNGK